MWRVIEVDIEVSHYFPLHEDVCKMNSIKQSTSTLECMVLWALNVNFHNTLTERYYIHKVIEDDSADDDWTASSAFLYLQHNETDTRGRLHI